jgi:hypothetical protein
VTPSDRLRAIIEAGRAAAAETAAATAATPGPSEVKNLVDKNTALPDALALRRLFQSEELERQLAPEDDEGSARPPTASPLRPAPTDELAAGAPIATTAPMSAAEVRLVLAELQQTFGEGSYTVRESKSRPEEIVVDPNAEEEPVFTPDRGWVVGTLIAVVLIAGFIYAITLGPLKPAPAPEATPSPSAAASPNPSR